ncbi:YitT family protein [uncultured Negativibacillus sp.]|uniref:YitT family protein n=1 Tax=uncultured Negativibacillus sp. TaxID=1980696 RepID=UPI0025FBDC94|nr:YitT family protein [uncultured Negativibacillus sp.]
MTKNAIVQKQNMAKTIAMDLLVDLIAGIAFGISVNVFTAPNHIAPGGVTGFATLMNYIFGVPIGLMSFCINVPLLLIGVRVLGKEFFFRTLKSVVIINFSVDVIVPMMVQGYVYTGEKIMAGLMGGVLMGVCVGSVLQRGSTSGGLDIVGRVVRKKMPQFSIGKIMFAGDFTILVVSMLVYKNIESGLNGLICIFVSSKVVDYLLYGMEKGMMLYVISDKAEEIAKEIMSSIVRGATMIQAEGAYSRDPKKVVLCAIKEHQYPEVKRLIKQIDPNAFLMVNDAHDILGSGFNDMNAD